MQRLKQLRKLVERLLSWSKRREAPTETERLLSYSTHTHTHKLQHSSVGVLYEPREYYVEAKPSHIRSKTTHQDMRTCLRCGKPYVILPNGFHMGCLRHFLLRGKIE